MDEGLKRKIAAIYRAGGYDSEAAAAIVQHEAGFEPVQFGQWYEEKPEFAALVDNCRILARAYWDKAVREGCRLVPDWYYSPPDESVRALIALACQAAERCPIGSKEREQEFRNVTKLIDAAKRGL